LANGRELRVYAPAVGGPPTFIEINLNEVDSVNEPSGLTAPQGTTKKPASWAVFSASTSAAGAELWISDGSINGTKLAQDIYPGNRSSDPYGFIAFGSNVVFGATDPKIGTELFVFDGKNAKGIDVNKASSKNVKNAGTITKLCISPLSTSLFCK